MSSLEKYTLLELSDPSLAHQIVTEITEDLFCAIAVEPIFVAVIQDGHKAGTFDDDLFKFISSLPAQCKGDNIPALNMWEVLEDDSISRGITTAISTHVRSLAAHRNAATADAEVGYLMSFNEGAVSGARAPATRSAPKFKLDFTTAQALIDRKAYEGLDIAAYTAILNSECYYEFLSTQLYYVLFAYSYRLKVALSEDANLWVHRKLKNWGHDMCEIPPHLIRFTPYKPEQNSKIWSLFASKPKDQLRPEYVRMHWNCTGHERYLDIPERIVQATKAAIATAPKVPYLASEYLSSVPLFSPKCHNKRYAKGAAIPGHILQEWIFEKERDLRATARYGDT